MKTFELMQLSNVMEAEDWDDYNNPSVDDLKKFKQIVKDEGLLKEYLDVKKFNKKHGDIFFITAFSHL